MNENISGSRFCLNLNPLRFEYDESEIRERLSFLFQKNTLYRDVTHFSLIKKISFHDSFYVRIILILQNAVAMVMAALNTHTQVCCTHKSENTDFNEPGSCNSLHVVLSESILCNCF